MRFNEFLNVIEEMHWEGQYRGGVQLEAVTDRTKAAIYQKITADGLPARRGVKVNRTTRPYATDPGDLGRGIYYTTNYHVARSYSQNVEKSVIRLRNPLVLDVEEAYQLADRYHTVTLPPEQLRQLDQGERMAQLVANAERLTRDLIDKGHDGLVAIHKRHIEIVDYRPYVNK